MITITQFTLPQLRAAHDILKQGQQADETPTEPLATDAVQAADKEPVAAEEVPSAAEASTDSPADGETAAKEQSTSSSIKSPSAELLAKLAAEVPLAENKVVYMVGALAAAGARVSRLRQVRVVQVENAPANAIKREEAAYILDLLPDHRAKGAQKGRNEGRDGGRKGGPGKGRGKDGGRPGDKRGAAGRGAGTSQDRRSVAGRGPGRPGEPKP